jgi:lipoic acid synthetase
MGRELPMFQPPGAHEHATLPPTIAMGGPGRFEGAPDGSQPLRRHPEWIKARLPSGENYHDLKRILRGLSLNTVCEQAHCPNIGECWEQRTATIMILGDVCTRACGFCAVKTGRPSWNDEDEPRRVAQAIAEMRLEHVVVTSVARDDLPDGGAHVFAETIRTLRRECPGMGVEVLIPDFNGAEAPLRTVMEAGPDILNHNLETVERLQKPVRKRARYARSLGVLERAKAYATELAGRADSVHTKSSLMVGLGEEREELSQAFRDLRAVDCDILTIGQYLRPSEQHLPLVRYYHPDEFAEMKAEALALGFKHVESGPLVRSSYHARDQVPDSVKRARTTREAALAANGLAGADARSTPAGGGPA